MPGEQLYGKSGHGGKISRKQELAIVALLTEPNHRAAAVACGVGYSTLCRWLRDPQFEECFRRAKADLLASATAQLRRAATTGALTLEQIANDGKAPPAARVSASRAILELALRANVIEEIDERLAKLELLREDEDE
jgi:hypothetical protein